MRLLIFRAQVPEDGWRKAIPLIGVAVVYVLDVSNKREACEVGLTQSAHVLELRSKLKTRRFAVAPYARVPAEVYSAVFALALMPSVYFELAVLWLTKTRHPKEDTSVGVPNMKCVKYGSVVPPLAVATMSIPAYTEPEVKVTVLSNALLTSSALALVTVIAP
jgi:hypothetical protein